MKIIIPVINFGRAGGYRVLSKLADSLCDLGHDVIFVVPETIPEPYYSTKAKIVKTPCSKNSRKVSGYIYKMYSLYKGVKNQKYGIVIANQHITAYLVAFLPRNFERYYYIQANETKLVNGSIKKLIAFLTYLLPLKKIVNSKSLLPKIVNNYVGFLPAGVDLDLFSSKSCIRNDFSKNKLRIGLIGRKEKYKGTKEIVNALSSINDDFSNRIKINIAVFKPEIPTSMEDITSFRSISSDKELAEFYSENDLIIATGLIEGGAFHYPCAEGMASGRIVISNYAPLSNTTSSLYIDSEGVAEHDIYEKILKVLEYDKVDIAKEVENNYLEIQEYSWFNIGKKMNDILNGNSNE